MAVSRPRKNPPTPKVSPEFAKQVRKTGKYDQAPVYTARLENAAVTGTKLADGAVGQAKIVDAAINTTKIADAAVTRAKITANAISPVELADAAVTTNFNSDGTTNRSHIAVDSVGRGQLQSSADNNNLRAVANNHIRDNAVTTRTMSPNAVGGGILSSSSSDDTARAVNTDHIKTNAVTARTIAANVVGSGHIAENAVGTTQLAAQSVTGNIIIDGLKNPVQGTAGLRTIAGSGTGVAAAAWNHTHSISFKHLPLPAQRKLLKLRQRVRDMARNTSRPTDTRTICWSLVGIMTLLFDEEDGTTAEERLKRFEDDPAYYEAWKEDELVANMPEGGTEERDILDPEAHPDLKDMPE